MTSKEPSAGPMSKWRNALLWALVGFVVYLCLMVAMSAAATGGVPDFLVKSQAIAVRVGVALALSTLFVGFSMRNTPVGLHSLRNFLVASGVAVAIVLAIKWCIGLVGGPAALKAMGLSAAIALILGLALVAFGLLGMVLIAAARAGALPPRPTEILLERMQVQLYSWTYIIALGLTLILLSLCGPAGLLSPTIALAGVAALIAVMTIIHFAIWPLQDELARTMARETGNAGFYLITIIGGGWAILAQLGFVTAPAPLDWLTLFTVIMFAASFIAIGRRGLLRS